MSVETLEDRQATGAPGATAGPTSRPGLLLAVCCVAQFMVILDLSIVNVALPSIQSSLNFSSADLQWVVDAYAITFAGFLMLGGRAADQLGHRRVFIAALVLFSLTSLVGGAAQSQVMLVVARGVQGLSCAFMAAASLAIITSSFPPGPQLHRAIGLWAAMNGAGGAAGTLFGGIITQELSWRWVLLINPPIGIAAAVIAYRVVADRRRGTRTGFDLPGALTLTAGQMVLVYGVVEAGLRSWNAPGALIPIIAGFVLLGAFCLIETRFASAPLVPFKELTKPLRDANLIVVLFSAALFPMWYLGSLYLQQVLGLSPLRTGLTFLPMALTIMVVARSAGKLVSRFGVRTVLGGGLTLMTAGMLLFTKIADGGSAIVYIVIPGLLIAAGIGMSIVPSTIAATQGAKQGQAGLASGLVNTSRQIGGGLGIAVLITLATSRSSHLIGHGYGVSQALTDGFRLGYFIGAALCAAAAVATFTLLPRLAADERPVRARAQFGSVIALAVLAFVVLDFAVGGSHAAPLGAYTTRSTYSYRSAPSLHPPVIRDDVATSPRDLAPGYIFLANFFDLNNPPIAGQSGPLILDNRLSPVWFQPVPKDQVASNLTLQTYDGKPALAWWQGVVTNTGATERGEDVIVNQHYQPIARLRGADGWVITLHELVIRGHDAWVTANKNLPMNLARFGGAYNGALIDSAVQEYDITSGKLIRSWDALDHIPLSDSYASLPTNGFPWDAYHVNAIDIPGDGSFVVSMRNTWAVYRVNVNTGRIEWTLGGKHSSFRFGTGARFEWQHDAVVYPNSPLMTVFDDHCCQITGGGTYVSASAPSRGLILKLDPGAGTATFAGQYMHGDNFDSEYMGSIEPLSNGNEFVGWGSQSYFSEYNSAGRMLLDAVLPTPDITYRAMVEPWVGLPLYPPAGAVRRRGAIATVYASWNGATQVRSWRVLAGADNGSLAPVDTASDSGFETAIPVGGDYKAFEVEALDSRGRVIGSSRVFGS